MDEDAIIDELEDIGFTEYQSQAYLAAVRLGRARFSELVEESGVPQQRIYDVVNTLSDEGLVEVHERSGVKEVVAPPPDVALEDLKERRTHELSRTVDAVVEGLQQSFQQAEPGEGFVTVVSHENSAERHARQAVQAAEWRLTLSLTPGAYDALEADIRDAADRGVTVKLLLQQGDEDDPFTGRTFPDSIDIRHRSSADRLVAADREYGVFQGVASDVVSRPYLVTRDRNLVVVLQRYSSQFWAGSRSIQDPDWTARRYMNPWNFIVDLRAEIDANADLLVTVEGIETQSGREGTWEGRITDYQLQLREDVDPATALPEVVSITLDTGDMELTVGGWDATLEDIAAYGIEVSRE
ncbi:MAG: TrmB family transcriptional regulator [Halolamina sp.]